MKLTVRSGFNIIHASLPLTFSLAKASNQGERKDGLPVIGPSPANTPGKAVSIVYSFGLLIPKTVARSFFPCLSSPCLCCLKQSLQSSLAYYTFNICLTLGGAEQTTSLVFELLPMAISPSLQMFYGCFYLEMSLEVILTSKDSQKLRMQEKVKKLGDQPVYDNDCIIRPTPYAWLAWLWHLNPQAQASNLLNLFN